MDQKLRQEIRNDVQTAIMATVAKMQEKWVSAEDLCAQFSMITLKLLKEHGEIFPRKRMKFTGSNGKTHTTRWAYPVHQIAMNIANGMYDDLHLLKDI